MLTYPAIDPIIFSVGPVAIRWYGLTYVIAFACGWWLARRRAALPGSTWTAQEVDDLIFYNALGVIIGGRVGWVLFYGFEGILEEPLRLFYIWEGGMSFHGGLLGVLLAGALFARARRKHIGDVCDFLAPLPGLGIFAVRVANFINGELWGKPTTVPWAFNVDPSQLHTSQAAEAYRLCERFAVDPCVLTLHASQLYEAVLEGLVLFVVLWWFTSRSRPRYAASGLVLMTYGIARFAVEFVRVPDANRPYFFGDWGTMGQLLSAPMIVAGLALMIIAYRQRTPSGNVNPTLRAEAA